MVHKVLFWSCFGVATRLMTLALQMRPFFQRQSLWVFPVYASVGGSFGYWLSGVEQRQMKMLQHRKEILIEKRLRRDQREAEAAESGSVMAS